MAIKYGMLFLLLLAQLTSGCHFRSISTKEILFPTAVVEALESHQSRPTIDTTTIPTLIGTLDQSKMMGNETPIPSLSKPVITHIFPSSNTPDQQRNPELGELIEQIISQSGGRWHIIIKEVDGETMYSRFPDQRINIASVVKVPLALLFFEALKINGIPDDQLREYIQITGTGGRTFEQLLSAMLVKSEEDATEILFAYIKKSLNLPAQLREWDLSGIDLEARRYTTSGIASMFEQFYLGEFVSPTSRSIILEYLNTYTPNDESRIGILNNKIPEKYKIYNKRGSLLTPYVVADSAILENPEGTDFVLTIFAFNSEPKTTYERLDNAISDISLAFWEYISNNNVTIQIP